MSFKITILKRIVVFLLISMSLVTLELTSESSLLLSLPTDDEIIDSINDRDSQQDQIDAIIDEALNRDPDEEYETLFDNSVRHTFVIEFTSAEFDGLINDMNDYMDEYGTYKSNSYRNVTVTYIADDEIQVFENVGFRTKGHVFSRRLPIDEQGNVREVHFMLKFNHTFDLFENSVEYDALKTREAMGIEQILFKWNNTKDLGNMNEVFSYNMFEQIGVAVPRASFAEVQIVVDGKVELVTLYNIFEHFDEEFIRRHFQDEPKKEVGDLYKATYSATLDPIDDSDLYGVRNNELNERPIYSKETNKDVDSFDTLIRFSYGINDEDIEVRKAFLEENFNIDSFLRTMAMNVLLGNPDDYRGNGNNFYYYFDESGYMTYLPYDYDNSMGSGWDGKPAFIDYTLGNDIYTWGHFDWNTFGIPLWEHVIEHEEYQIIYENYLMQYINDGTYSKESYRALYDMTEALYSDIYTFIYDSFYANNCQQK